MIHSPVEAAVVNAVLGGEDPNSVALLPSGFAILPDEISGRGGSLLTVAFQIFIDSSPGSKIPSGTIDVVNSLLSCTCDRIKTIMSSSNVQ